jgi:cytidylate kinase
MVITISGRPGSGKSTVARRLAEHLNVPRLYVGDLRRRMARERGMTLEEFNKLGETDPTTDKIPDDEMVAFAHANQDCVIETRTGFHLIPGSLKIFLDVSEEEAAHRILGSLQHDAATRNEGKGLDTHEAVLASVRERIRNDNGRYQKYYGINIYDPSHYDLFLDTTHLTADQTFDQVAQFVAQHAKNT